MSDQARGHVIAVYRQRNEARVVRLVEEPLALGWTVSLWALDETVPSLEGHTVGCGPGGKWDLLNECLVARPCPPSSHLVLTDDDVTMARGGLPRFLDVMDAAGLDLAQPANGRGSYVSYEVNRRVRFSRARLTTFVEIGPVVGASPAWWPRIAPFPEGLGMGWGLDLVWRDLLAEGCRLGVVDAVPVRHPDTPGTSYNPKLAAEYERMGSQLERVGLTTMEAAQHTLAVWRPWQRRPPWHGRSG